MGFFEANDTSGAAMAIKLKYILDKFTFTLKIMAYVKGKGSNLQTCVKVLKMVVCCHHNMSKPFDGYSFGHTLLKVYQYANFDEKVACGLHYASLKSTQAEIHKCIKWPRKFNKGN